MALQQTISAEKLQAKVGRTIEILIDENGPEGAVGRSTADAPEIDGVVYLKSEANLSPGDVVSAQITDADAYDLYGHTD